MPYNNTRNLYISNVFFSFFFFSLSESNRTRIIMEFTEHTPAKVIRSISSDGIWTEDHLWSWETIERLREIFFFVTKRRPACIDRADERWTYWREKIFQVHVAVPSDRRRRRQRTRKMWTQTPSEAFSNCETSTLVLVRKTLKSEVISPHLQRSGIFYSHSYIFQFFFG